MISKSDLSWWLDLERELDWQFATTYAERAPHEYVVVGRTPGLTEDDVVRAAHVIRTFGEPMKFFSATRIYLTTPSGWKHWDMQGGRIDAASVTLINRGRAEHVYGVQNAPRTASGSPSPYDGYATRWDEDYGMDESERAATAGLIRATFGERLCRTLDIGCGTGWPVDAALAEPVRYVGIDPSTGMLNALVAKHPHLAGVHPMTFTEALDRRVLGGTVFDTILALGGAASYLSPCEIDALRARAKRNALLMHYAPEHEPIVGALDAAANASSLAAASAVAREQKRIGRFVASVI